MDKLFWARLTKVTFAFAEKRLEHLESREILCVHRPKSLIALYVQEYKISTEQNHCLCKNVIYRLSINKPTKGTDAASRYQSTSSEPRLNCAPRVVTCITSRGDLKRTMWVLCNSTFLPSLLWCKRLCLR